MSLDVTSWFKAQAASGYLAPQRRLLLGSSDYSDWVLRWPTLTARSETIDLGTATVGLSNIGQRFNSLVDGGALLTTSCQIALGLTHPTSGTEWLMLYAGQPSHVSFSVNGAELDLQLQGKTRSLTDTALGTAATSGGEDYTGSGTYPADLAWALVTSGGGLSAVQSTSNPDLDYAQWQAWRSADVVRDVRAKGYLTGQKLYQVLDDLATLDSMTIGFAAGRLTFADLYGPYSSQGALPMQHALDVSLAVDPSAVINQFGTETTYDPGTGRFAAQVSRANSASQALYGPRAGRFSPRGVWFSAANDGLFFVTDQVRFGKDPRPQLDVSATFAAGLHWTPGDVVTLTHTHLGISSREFRITEREIDLQDVTLRFTLEPARHRLWDYQAQVSSVNLRVRTLTSVSCGALLGVEEGGFAGRVLRTDSAGVFQPMGYYGTATFALDPLQVLIGGPPASGSTQSVLRRSSDGGSSSVVVASLGAGTRAVFDFFQVHSGTCLASATSGGIYRSTSAGSSWALTFTVSPGYNIQRFLQPVSGTLWAATGFDIGALTNGLFLWESVDDGVTWVPRHTVVASGDYNADGFYALNGSEYLLSTFGAGIPAINLLRGTRTSPTSIGWTIVLSQISFANLVTTTSGHLLFGFDEDLTTNGGAVYRSLDAGSSWTEDGRLSKQGNVRLVPQSGGVLDAYLSRTTAGARTYRYRDYAPNEIA